MPPLRLVTFDALHTIITPRLPIHVQYSQAFTPYLGVLSPDAIKQSFKVALKFAQKECPSYQKGAESWWADVIRRTALNAGADQVRLDASLPYIIPNLMQRFSSRDGYKAFPDAIPTIRCLQENGVQIAIVSNGDSRIRAVLKDLDFPSYIRPIVLSEEEGVEKPSTEIFMRTLDRVNAEIGTESDIKPIECLHIGDELAVDYYGAKDAGFNALLLRRCGLEGQQRYEDEDEVRDGVQVIHSLQCITNKYISNTSTRDALL